MSDLMTKIAKLLNQSEHAATPEEADAFLSMAQTLSTRHSIDLAVARAHTAKTQKVQVPEKRMCSFDGASRNNKKHLVSLFSTIARSNDARIDIAHDSTYVIAYGFTTDLDVVEALFAHLSVQMVSDANDFIASGKHKDETQMGWVRTKKYSSMGDHWDSKRQEWYYWGEEWGHKPVDGRVARSNFYVGFIAAVYKRLRDARSEAVAEAEAETSGAALVLVDKTKSVEAFYKGTSTARGRWSGAGSNAYSATAHASGRKSGESATMGGQRAINGGRRAINA